MIFTPTELPNAYIIDPERREDARGFFARAWCAQEFQAHGLNPHLVQCSMSYNTRRGTLRGMHYQASPYEEAKLIRCTRGAIYDVIVDLREASRSFTHYVGVELTAENRTMLYVPEGCAHGFMTLVDDTEVYYQMSQVFSPTHARGVRWDDPAFGIAWPELEPIMLDRDRTYPDFQPGGPA
jgi:dTDP-4-dehydrorhamnose 3,5-epimerase